MGLPIMFTSNDGSITPPPPPSDSLPLTVVSKTASRIVVTWTPPGDCDGYAFFVDGIRKSNTWNPAQSQTAFGVSPGPHTYAVRAIKYDVSGHVTDG